MGDEASDSPRILLKLLLVGHAFVGKSCILLRYSENVFSNSIYSSIGVDFKLKSITVEDKHFKLQIWEPSGGERYRSMAPSYYRGALAVFLVFDISSRETFDRLATFQDEMNRCTEDEHVLRILVGNKTDLENREVQRNEAEEYAGSHGMKYVECSAKTGEGVERLFEGAVADIIHSQPLWDRVVRYVTSGGSKKKKKSSSPCCACS